jgi:transcriptional regulator with XRE-family HTH domain
MKYTTLISHIINVNDMSYVKYILESDNILLNRIGAFVKYQRILQNKTQQETAIAAGISRSTLSLLERGETVTVLTLLQVLRVLNQLQFLETFEIKEEVSPLELLKKNKPPRQRVRKSKSDKNNQGSEW